MGISWELKIHYLPLGEMSDMRVLPDKLVPRCTSKGLNNQQKIARMSRFPFRLYKATSYHLLLLSFAFHIHLPISVPFVT